MIPVAEMEQRKRVTAIRALGHWAESLVSVRKKENGKSPHILRLGGDMK